MSGRDLFLNSAGALRTPWRLATFIIIAIAATLIMLWLVSLVVPLSPPDSAAVTEKSFGTIVAASWAFVGGLLFAHFVMLRLVDRMPWSYVGLGRDQASIRRLGGGFILGALTIGIPSLALLSLDWLEPYPASVVGAAEWLRFAAMMTWFLLPAALAEELMFRGYPFAVLREKLGWQVSIVTTSVIFGLLHWQNPSAGLQPLVLVMLAGVFLAAILLVSGSLYAAWMAHFAWNWTMVALLHADVSGVMPLPPPGYRIADAGPDWVTGGAWGPEGGAGAALGMGAAIYYLVYHRARIRRASLPDA
ncbi:MAG: lysostaphin resistance A-like protein [Gemmatimonadaceae bacterium]